MITYRGTVSHSPDTGGDPRFVSLDYSNDALIRLPAYTFYDNSSQCWMCRCGWIFNYVAPTTSPKHLSVLRWKHAPERIQFKITMVTFKALHGNALRHLVCLNYLVDVVSFSVNTNRLVGLASEHIRLLQPKRGTAYRRTWRHHQLCQPSQLSQSKHT